MVIYHVSNALLPHSLTPRVPLPPHIGLVSPEPLPTILASEMVHDGWMDGWMDGWKDGWLDGWLDGWMNAWMDGWMDGLMDGWMKVRDTAFALV